MWTVLAETQSVCAQTLTSMSDGTSEAWLLALLPLVALLMPHKRLTGLLEPSSMPWFQEQLWFSPMREQPDANKSIFTASITVPASQSQHIY